MIQKTRRLRHQLTAPVDDLEHLEHLVRQAVKISLPNEKKYRPTELDESTLEEGNLWTNLPAQESGRMDTRQGSLT